MRKFIKFLIILALPLSLIFVTSCDTDKFELFIDDFNTTIKYNSEVSLTNLKLKNVEDNTLVDIEDSMIIDPIDTTKVGIDKLVIQYGDLKYELEVNIKYEVIFNIRDTKDIQYVTDINELNIPSEDELNTDLEIFNGFIPNIPENINDNLSFEATFLNKSTDIPKLEEFYEVYYENTLEDIKLPENLAGKWVFLDENIIFNEMKDYELEVKYIPYDETYASKNDKILVKVLKKQVEFKDVISETTYNGLEQRVSYNIPEGLEVNELYDDFEIGEYPINAGTYNYSIEVIGNEYYEGNVLSGKFIINKAKLNITLPSIRKSFIFPNEEVNINIDEIINNDTFNIEGNFKMNKEFIDSLNLSLKKNTYTSLGNFNYTLNYQNPNFDITFNEATIEIIKGDIDPSKLLLPTINAEYSNLLKDVIITNPNINYGKYTPKSPNKKLETVGKTKEIFIFIPTLDIYNSFEIELEFEISKKKLNLEEYLINNIFDYNGQGLQILFDFKSLDLNLLGNDPEINAGTYNKKLIIDSKYYSGQLDTTLIVNKINPVFDLPNNLEIFINSKYDEVTLPTYDNGTLVYLNPNDMFNQSGNILVSVRFIPNDKINYNEVETNITVLVKKLEAKITCSDNQSFILDDDNKIIYSINNPESEVKITYLRQNEANEYVEVVDFNFVGKYKAILYAEETTSYLATSITINFIVYPKKPVAPGEVLEAYYGDKLSNIVFDKIEIGSWAWKEPDTILNIIGENSFTAIYTDDLGNTREEVVIVNVLKKKVNINIINNEFTYDALSHEIEYSTDINDLKVIGNKSYVNAGSYLITLTIESDYYQGSIETYLIINKAHLEDILYSVNDTEYKALNDDIIELDYTKDLVINIIPYLNDFNFDNEYELLINNINYKDIIINEPNIYKLVFRCKSGNFDNEKIVVTLNVYNIIVSKDTNFNNGEKYTSIEYALENTKNNTDKTYIYLLNSETLSSYLTTQYIVGKNVILYLPHEARTNYIEYNLKSDLVNTVSKTPSLYLSLTIESDVTLDIQGKVEVGANRGQAQPLSNHIAQAYSKIINDGKILVNGILHVAGIISGEGQVEANNKGKIYELFQLKDWRGGTNAAGLYGPVSHKNAIAPFADYRIRSITCRTTFYYGSSLIGIASINASDTWTSAEYPFIGKGAILEIQDENSKIIRYFSDELYEIPQVNSEGKPINQNQDGIDKSFNKAIFELYGNITDNPGKLSITVLIITVTISTEDVYLGIGYSSKIIIKENANFTSNCHYKLLPGNEVIIEKNATVNINKNIIVYPKWNDVGYNNNWYYPHELALPKLINNGNIVIGENGALAGILLSEGEGATISTNKTISLTSREAFSTDKTIFGPKYTLTATINEVLKGKDNVPLEANSKYTYNGSTWVKS